MASSAGLQLKICGKPRAWTLFFSRCTGQRSSERKTPIEDLLEQLGRHGFVFVMGDQGVDRLRYPNDLDRHAARSHFYLLIAAIEMLLAGLVRAAVPASDHREGDSR